MIPEPGKTSAEAVESVGALSKQQAGGLTLIETLVALAVMGVIMTAGYVTIQESLKLHRANSQEANRLLARCHLAEQLTADFRLHRDARHADNGWEITRADGSTVRYARQKDSLARSEWGAASGTKTYDVGAVEVSLSGASLRLKFSDTELVIAR